MFLSIVQPLQTLTSQPDIVQTHRTLFSILSEAPNRSEIFNLSGRIVETLDLMDSNMLSK